MTVVTVVTVVTQKKTFFFTKKKPKFFSLIFSLPKCLFIKYFFFHKQKNFFHLKTVFTRKLFFITKNLLTKKSCNLFTKKFKQPLHTVSQQNHCENCKMLPWEHHICCQMCKIAYSKIAEKVNKKIWFFCWCCMIFVEVAWFLSRLRDFSQGSVLRFSQCFYKVLELVRGGSIL